MAAGPDPEGRDWSRTALWLVGLTACYNLIESAIAIAAGLAAGSLSLVAFGLDSVIELSAALAILWHLRWERQPRDIAAHDRSERRVRRFIGATFLALAAYVAIEAGFVLWQRAAPEESVIGMVLAATSLALMPALSWAKLRAADRLDDPALRAEAKETLACTYLSLVLLIGLALNAAWGWWWADPAAAAPDDPVARL